MNEINPLAVAAILGLSWAIACSAPVSEAPTAGTGGAGMDSVDTQTGSGGSRFGQVPDTEGGFGEMKSGSGGAGTGGADQGRGPSDFCAAASGAAPSGELSATQVMAANAESNQSYHLLEGPVWLDGALYYSHFSNAAASWPSQIKRYTPGGSVEVFEASSGSNGLAVDGEGNLLAATHDQKEISLFNVTTKERTTLVGAYMDNPLNAPNDIVVAPNGDVFFTDPDSDQKSAAPGGQDMARVYRWDGVSLSVVDDSFKPNGIAISPDGEFLFVSGGGYSGKLRKYPLVDGVPGAGVDVMPLLEPDGMTFDCLGNLYVTEHVATSNQSRVRVFDPDDNEIAAIAVGPAVGVGYSDVEAKATNVTFGGPQGKTLFITATFSLWQIELDVEGLPY